MAGYLEFLTGLDVASRINTPAISAGVANTVSITIKFRLPSLAALQYLLGKAASTAFRVSVGTTGQLSFANTVVTLSSATGVITANTVTWVRLRQDATNIYLESSTDGVNFTIHQQAAKAGTLLVDSVFQYNNTRSRGNFLYGLRYVVDGVVTEWNESSAPATGTTWPPATGSGDLTLVNFTGVPADSWWITTVILTTLKYWTGSAWVRKPLKYWNGSAWVQKVLKYWNGTAWVNK